MIYFLSSKILILERYTLRILFINHPLNSQNPKHLKIPSLLKLKISKNIYIIIIGFSLLPIRASKTTLFFHLNCSFNK